MTEETKPQNEQPPLESPPMTPPESSPPPPPPVLTQEELLRMVYVQGHALRDLILQVKRFQSANIEPGKFEAYNDPMRALSIAQTELQTGFRWLIQSINRNTNF